MGRNTLQYDDMSEEHKRQATGCACAVNKFIAGNIYKNTQATKGKATFGNSGKYTFSTC